MDETISQAGKDQLAGDIAEILEDRSIDWSRFDGRSIAVTGATGAIASLLVRALAGYAHSAGKSLAIFAMVRNRNKAETMFVQEISDGYVHVIDWDPLAERQDPDFKADYMVHAASVTASKVYVEKPVDTILTNTEGTASVLKYAKDAHVKSLVYLSTMEVYGASEDDNEIKENRFFPLDCAVVRSSYPESKRIAETMCVAYASQYSVPVKIARLVQTVGIEGNRADGKVVSEFAGCAIDGRKIVLLTRGDTARSFLYSTDAVRAILQILLNGENGVAYNVANASNYCTIKEMAEIVCDEYHLPLYIAADSLQAESRGWYTHVVRLNLDTSRLTGLGWNPQISIREMFRRIVGAWRCAL